MAFIATVTILAETDTVRLVTDPEPKGFVVTLFDSNGLEVDSKVGDALSTTFENLSAGAYSVTAALQDTAGNAIGGTARTEFTITDDPVDSITVKTVSGLSVSVAKAQVVPAPAPAPAPSVPAAPTV